MCCKVSPSSIVWFFGFSQWRGGDITYLFLAAVLFSAKIMCVNLSNLIIFEIPWLLHSHMSGDILIR